MSERSTRISTTDDGQRRTTNQNHNVKVFWPSNHYSRRAQTSPPSYRKSRSLQSTEEVYASIARSNIKNNAWIRSPCAYRIAEHRYIPHGWDTKGWMISHRNIKNNDIYVYLYIGIYVYICKYVHFGIQKVSKTVQNDSKGNHKEPMNLPRHPWWAGSNKKIEKGRQKTHNCGSIFLPNHL